MKRAAMMMAMAMLMSAGITRAAAQGKTMTAVGAVKTVTAESLAINDGPGKDWTFVINSKTKVYPKNEIPKAPATTDLKSDLPPNLKITDLKEGQRVQVKYRAANGKDLATEVRIK
jgi:Cu/Ag efflux protein CusF